MPVIIGIAGRAGSGKSTLAQFLRVLLPHAEIIPMAQGVKDVATYMGWDGKKDAKGRRLLQLIGTECGRECIGEDVWVHAFLRKVNASSSDYIICDDVRFDNEARAIRQAGGLIIQIAGREDASVDASHPSELGISSTYVWHKHYNVDDIRELQAAAVELAERIQG